MTKLPAFLAAFGLAAGTIAVPAGAQVVTRTVTTTRTVNHSATRHGWNGHRGHRVCRSFWRNHHKVTRCYYR